MWVKSTNSHILQENQINYSCFSHISYTFAHGIPIKEKKQSINFGLKD